MSLNLSLTLISRFLTIKVIFYGKNVPQLNSIQRAQVIAHIQDGIPIRDVAHIMNTSKNTVQKIKCRWEIEEILVKKKTNRQTYS